MFHLFDGAPSGRSVWPLLTNVLLIYSWRVDERVQESLYFDPFSDPLGSSMM